MLSQKQKLSILNKVQRDLMNSLGENRSRKMDRVLTHSYVGLCNRLVTAVYNELQSIQKSRPNDFTTMLRNCENTLRTFLPEVYELMVQRFPKRSIGTIYFWTPDVHGTRCRILFLQDVINQMEECCTQ